jgi:dTDP-4-amino-4,6-dideoxygalactose transaminase
MIRFLEPEAGFAELAEPIRAATERVLMHGPYIGGPECAAFEEEFAAHVGAANGIGCGNGLDAIVLALRAFGIGKGDEVIVPSHTYIATWLAVSAVGANVVPVEPDPATMQIDPAQIENAITSATRVILPVHLYGVPSDMPAIEAIAERHGLIVIADAAQAHGAAIGDRPVGAFGDAACWSFYPGKNLGAAGDGGAVTCREPEIAARVRMLSNYGSTHKYHNEERGTNSRLDPLQAAILRTKLGLLDEWNERRRAIAGLYLDSLAPFGCDLPSVPDGSRSAWHLFVIRLDDRDRVQAALHAAGVQTLLHYPVPPHLQPAYADKGWAEGAFPIAEAMAHRALSLPIGPHMPLRDAARVADSLAAILT